MVDSPFITVVLPTLNEAGYIETCLRTLLDDPFPRDRLEVFVVDGGSSDGTRAIVEQLRSEFPFIRLLDNPQRTIDRMVAFRERERFKASLQGPAPSAPTVTQLVADPTTLAAIAGAVVGALQVHAARSASAGTNQHTEDQPEPEPLPAPVGEAIAVSRRDDLGRWVEASVATPGGAWTATPRRDELGRTRAVEYAGPNGAKVTMNVQLDELGRIERIAHA